MEKLKKSVDKQYSFRDVQFLSRITRKEVLDLYKSAKLFYMGAGLRFFPLVIAESVAVELPYISTDVGNVKFLPGGVIVKNPTRNGDVDRQINHK